MNTMHIQTHKEYKVLLTPQPLHTQADGQQWGAIVLEFPSTLLLDSRVLRDQHLNERRQ
jgi:hypothetical protein